MPFYRISLPGALLCLCLLLPGCVKDGLPGNAGQSEIHTSVQQGFPVYTSYKDIPGVTQDEIDAIETLRSSGQGFTYGMTNSSECFADDRRGIGGFASLYCRWLSGLFGIEFTPAIRDWDGLLNGLESGSIDFTGELSVTPEWTNRYYMTSTIVERPITLTRLINTSEPAVIAPLRHPRLAFLSDSATRSMVAPMVPYEFDTVYVSMAKDAYRMLREKQIDAFIVEGFEAEAVTYSDLMVAEILPHIYSSITMAAQKPDLAPVISVVQKYLDQGGLHHLVPLYNQGYQQYLSYCFRTSLSPEETVWVDQRDNIDGEAIPIPVIMENSNYPTAFYNKTEKVWQGIAWDVLKEIEKITDLRFEVVSGTDDTFLENLDQLERGEGFILSELIQTDDRKDRFLWGSDSYSKDNFALLSRQETPDMGFNEIFYARVALIRGTAQEELFLQWFPDHRNIVEYVTMEAALDALKKDEVDLFMASRNTLLTFTNYMEEPGFKANRIFYRTANSYFGFNRNEAILCSVINKAQALVNTDLLENRWLSRIFDYRTKIIRARQPYLIGFSILLGVVIFLLITLLQKYRESGQELEMMVKFRTQELEERSRELEVQKNAAQTAYTVKNRFLANMSHEIRTPLNAIIGLSQQEMDKPSSGSRENLVSINHSGSALLSVVNDLLDISSIESGEMELKTADYMLPALLSDSTISARMRIGGKPIGFRVELNERLPVKLHGDRHRIGQILGNLLSNAVKFTHTGSVVLRVDFETVPGKYAMEAILLCFEVRDTGVGIKTGDIQKIFTDYGQAATDTLAGGTGMGLLITKKLAELMGGTVGAVSEYGKGSVFTAKIPQAVANPAALGGDTAEKLRNFNWKEIQEEKPLLPYARVLVVDDVSTNHAVARGIMKPYRMTVDAVLSGQEAVDIIAGGEPRYDAIFMDHMMPGMDGIEAARYIRALDTEYARTIPIIALTANALPENEELFLGSGFNAFMAKPINVNVLTQVLIKWVQDPEKEENAAAGGEQEEEKIEQKTDALKGYSIEGIDLAAGASQFGGADAYLEIVKVFVNDTPKLLTEIKKWLDGFRIMPAAAAAALDALKQYTITIHGIKGSCYGICAAPVGDLAKELEMAAKSNDLGKVMELNNSFVQAAEKLVNELQLLFSRKEESSKPKKNAPDPFLLQKLQDAASAYNINEMFETLDELESCEYREDGELVRLLRAAAESYEYTEVIDRINKALESEDTLSGAAG